jgi:hypothetical protein
MLHWTRKSSNKAKDWVNRSSSISECSKQEKRIKKKEEKTTRIKYYFINSFKDLRFVFFLVFFPKKTKQK